MNRTPESKSSVGSTNLSEELDSLDGYSLRLNTLPPGEVEFGSVLTLDDPDTLSLDESTLSSEDGEKSPDSLEERASFRTTLARILSPSKLETRNQSSSLLEPRKLSASKIEQSFVLTIDEDLKKSNLNLGGGRKLTSNYSRRVGFDLSTSDENLMDPSSRKTLIHLTNVSQIFI